MNTRIVLLAGMLGAMALPQSALAQSSPHDVTIVLAEAVETVEPCQTSVTPIGQSLKENVVETLTELQPDDGTVLPRLAESWQQMDKNTWRFKLRQGVKFQDGKDFNADAVSYAINRFMDKALDCVTRNKFFGTMSVTPKVVDASTIDITTDTPQPVLPALLSNLTIPSPDTKMGEASQHPVGTGPYEFKSWNSGQSLVLQRFDGYWGEKPAVEQATYIWRDESAIRAAMVQTGEADIAPSIAQQDATNPATDFSYPNSETTRIRIGTDQPPLNDVRVRQAMNLAVNREAFVNTILSKDVVPASQLVLPSTSGYNPDLKPWTFDLDKAKQLLAAAKADGVPVDGEIMLYGRDGLFPNMQEVLEALIQMWSDAGLNVKLQMMEGVQELKLATKPFAANRPPSMFVDMHDNTTGDAGLTMQYKYASAAPQSDISDAQLDALIAKAAASTGDERRDLYRQAFARLTTDLVPDVMLFHMVGVTRVNPRLSFRPTVATNSELQLAQLKFNN